MPKTHRPQISIPNHKLNEDIHKIIDKASGDRDNLNNKSLNLS